MITSSAQGIRFCNGCHSEIDSFRIFLKMSLYGQNMVSESPRGIQSTETSFYTKFYTPFFRASLGYSGYLRCLMGLTFPVTHIRGTSLWKSTVVKGKFTF